MGQGEIEVNTAGLCEAGNSCGTAADSVRRADDELAALSTDPGIFGDFAEATAFHGKFSMAHQSHRERLQGHHSALMRSSEQAELAARAFRGADESAADEIDAVGGEID